ncbi:hypothetical protein ACRRTK_023360 [Alexandromys fortis]
MPTRSSLAEEIFQTQRLSWINTKGSRMQPTLVAPLPHLGKLPEVKFKITVPERSIKRPLCVPREVKYSAHSRFSSLAQNSLFHGNASWDVYMTFFFNSIQQQSTVLGNLSIQSVFLT